MAKKEAYERFKTLSEKVKHLIEIHGSKDTRHFSKYEIELLGMAIERLQFSESALGKRSPEALAKSKEEFDTEYIASFEKYIKSNFENNSKEERKLLFGINYKLKFYSWNVYSRPHLAVEKSVLKSEKAIQMMEAGNTIKLICKVLDVSAPIVGKWKKEHIFRLFKKGMSVKKVSQKYRVNYSKAKEWRRAAIGISSKKSTTNSNRSLAAKKGAQTKAANKKKRSDAAKKGAQTKAANKKKRSDAAKKGAQTRAANKKKSKKRKRPRYSAKFQREAMKLIREGHTGIEVSNILGVNKETIRLWRKKHGLSGETKTHSTSTQNDVLDLIRSGKSNSEIAKITGVSSTTVANWKKRFEKEGF
jgi:DNA-binding CsgD family transcriptional regulator